MVLTNMRKDMQELMINFIKKHPIITATSIAGLFVSMGIMGLTGSFWAGILAIGIIMLFITLGYAMMEYS